MKARSAGGFRTSFDPVLRSAAAMVCGAPANAPRGPFYFTIGWSATDAEDHPEWCVRNKDGSLATINWGENAAPTDRRPIVSWKS